MRSLFRYFRKKLFSYDPLIEVTISRDALLHNLKMYSAILPCAPVLKSNAYGHGLREVASILDGPTIPFFVVDSYYEALILRNERIRAPILVIGYTPIATIMKRRLSRVSYTITSMQGLIEVAASLTRLQSFHLKIDTGMHRQGILVDELPEALAYIAKNPYIRITGICSHFADADSDDDTYTRRQIAVWNAVVPSLRSHFGDEIFIHLAASAGVHFSDDIDANCIRLGIGLYGIDPKGICASMPVLEMFTYITSVRTVHKGEYVGYGTTYCADRDCVIATIPVGYFEGVDRRLAEGGCVRIGGTFCPLAGSVSMNISSIDVTAIPEPRIGQRVQVVSADSSLPHSIFQAARICGVVPHELLVGIPAHLRRVIV